MSNYSLSTLRTALTRSESDNGRSFGQLYKKVVLRQALSSDEVDTLFRMINYFSTYGDSDVQKMAYSMALNYGLLSGDFEVLSHFANLLRYYPVTKLIEAAGGDTFKNTIDTELSNLLSESLLIIHLMLIVFSIRLLKIGNASSVNFFSQRTVIASQNLIDLYVAASRYLSNREGFLISLPSCSNPLSMCCLASFTMCFGFLSVVLVDVLIHMPRPNISIYAG